MSGVPRELRDDLVEHLLQGRRTGFVIVGAGRRVIRSGGDLSWFGLGDVDEGAPLPEAAETLLLPGDEHAHLPQIELVPGRSTDVHTWEGSGGTTLFLVDATEGAVRERRFQQKGNELSLTLRAMGVAAFERTGEGFERLGLPPSWMRGFEGAHDEDLLERFPFLESFVPEAERVWAAHGPGLARSTMWAETDDAGREWNLEALATRLEDGRRLLLLQSVGERYGERRRILQEARSRTLELGRLRREIDRKETLLHYIVHDLKGPLSGMVGTMSLLQKADLPEDRCRELLELGLQGARTQEAMITSLLQAFTAEVSAMERFETDPERAPDLVACAEAASEIYRAAYERDGVELDVELDPALPAVRAVVGEADRLERVLSNLLENALRHSPSGGCVLVRIGPGDSSLVLRVEDEGPGVAPERRDVIFERFRRDAGAGGAAGLGLSFCRTTLERWGGSIVCEEAPGGGASFRVELARAR